jgi:hypothetical protein
MSMQEPKSWQRNSQRGSAAVGAENISEPGVLPPGDSPRNAKQLAVTGGKNDSKRRAQNRPAVAKTETWTRARESRRNRRQIQTARWISQLRLDPQAAKIVSGIRIPAATEPIRPVDGDWIEAPKLSADLGARPTAGWQKLEPTKNTSVKTRKASTCRKSSRQQTRRSRHCLLSGDRTEKPS